ncbi:MAG: hypothetical protein GY795_11800 [Desulfobacterales bacterium]|nr:hypothetical protein [Desulfobacterales bacterium]
MNIKLQKAARWFVKSRARLLADEFIKDHVYEQLFLSGLQVWNIKFDSEKYTFEDNRFVARGSVIIKSKKKYKNLIKENSQTSQTYDFQISFSENMQIIERQSYVRRS